MSSVGVSSVGSAIAVNVVTGTSNDGWTAGARHAPKRSHTEAAPSAARMPNAVPEPLRQRPGVPCRAQPDRAPNEERQRVEDPERERQIATREPNLVPHPVIE